MKTGFTLLELLVVVVIISIIAGALLLSVRTTGDDERALRAIDEISGRFAAACEGASISNANHGLALSLTNYEVLKQTPGGAWLNVERGRRGSQIALVENLQFALDVEGQEALLNPQPPPEPNVICYGSGEMTPFELRLENRANGEVMAALRGDLQGRLTRPNATAR